MAALRRVARVRDAIRPSDDSLGCYRIDRKSTRLNSSHANISYAVFCLKKKNKRLNSSHANISYAVFCLKKKKSTLKACPVINYNATRITDREFTWYTQRDRPSVHTAD